MSALVPPEGHVVDGVHHFAIRVYYEDTDAGGIVYYANYFKFCERARTEFLRCCGIVHERLLAENGLTLAVRRAEIDFLVPARLDDALVVRSRLVAAAGATLDMAQEVRREDAVLARMQLRIACVGSGGRPRRLPPALATTVLSLIPPERTRVPEDAR
ncbi:MAG TPA: tol-pal system-associated acyl-CoA thioesterase [Stellaceae bacterium]|nr:tol-pal system-associated acyl-CoA thioesterase [Stellaceae bacterium]